MAVMKFHSTNNKDAVILKLQKALDDADALVIGAGAGLSTSAGLSIRENVWISILQILWSSIISKICIPAAFIHMIRWRSIGRTGAVTYILTVT